MDCPRCGVVHTGVLSTRRCSKRGTLRRRRECPCGHRFTTVEITVEAADASDRIVALRDEIARVLQSF